MAAADATRGSVSSSPSDIALRTRAATTTESRRSPRSLDGFGDRYAKYVLNLNAISHNYERFTPIPRVVHVTASGGGASLEPLSASDRRTAIRALRLIHVRVDVTRARMKLEAVCGPATSRDQLKCNEGDVVDSYTIVAGTRRSAG